MRKNTKNRIRSNLIILFSVLFSLSGWITLGINKVWIPLLDNHPLVKLTVAFISVMTAYNAAIVASIRNCIKEETQKDHNIILDELTLLKGAIPFSELDEKEYEHGHKNKNVTCEIWVISNTLQEAESDNDILLTIYENILKNNVIYYYILPDNAKSRMEIKALNANLQKLISGRKSKNFTGTIYYRFDDSLLNLISADYIDMVFFVDCIDKDTPEVLDESIEGYQCFSSKSNNNRYYYFPVDKDRIISITSSQKEKSFKNLDALRKG